MTTSGTARTRCGNLKIKYVVRLSAAERQESEEVLRKGKASAQRRQHAQILLKADEGPLGPAWTNQRTAESVGVSAQTVINVRRRLVEGGFEAALGRKKQVRPSRSIVLDGQKEARLIALACGKPPAGQARWTLRLLADRLVELQIVVSVSLETVRQSLKKTNCSPTAASTGASRRRPTPSSSARWRTSWRRITCRTTRTSRSSASTNARCS
jgi:transposase